ncbi:MAG: alpha/beta fold hydrolase [Actinomycetota bacterium]
MRTEAATFPGAQGQTLSAELDLPLGRPRAVALFAHCFSCGKDLRSVRRLAARLTDRGIAVARFDFTGLGRSGGDFADTNFSTNVGDLVAAADWLRQTYVAPSLLIGHSFGGTAVLAAAPRIAEIEAVVTLGAPADPSHVTHLFEESIDRIEADGEARVSIAGRPFTISKQFLDDVEAAELDPVLRDLTIPTLFMHSPQDEIVGIENAEILFAATSHPKSFIALDGADHLLSDQVDAEHAAEMMAAWVDQLLPVRPEPSDDVLVPAAEGEVVVAERGTGKFAQVVRVAERHALLADEPLGIGDDTGPAPYDFLLAALGTCTSMTLRMYADRKGWPLKDVAVRLKHAKVHAKDCENCETENGKVDLIERELVIVGDELDDEQRQRLLEIADRCPVHRSLHDETHITTELVPA